MKLTSLPFLEKKESSEYYLSLILRNEKAKAVIFEKVKNTIKYINQDEEEFANTIEDSSTEEFLNVLDKVITSAESVLPESIETHKTILALKDSWVEDNKIKKEYLEKLKKAGEELSLDPIGFLVFSESIVNLLQKEEGAPITAILVEVGKKYLTVSLVRNGKIIEVRSSEIHESASFTVDTLLKHFQSVEVMPARVIILEAGEDEITQEFLSHSWSKSLPFLHLPQISALPIQSDVKSVLLGAATQMGADLVFDTSSSIMEGVVKEKSEVIEKSPEGLDENIVKPASFTDEEKSHLDFVGKDKSLDFFGFSQNDIAKTGTPPPVLKTPITTADLEEQTKELPEELKMDEEARENVGTLGVLTAENAKKSFTNLLSYFKKINLSSLPFLKINGAKDKKLVFISASILILLLGFYFMFIFQTHAKINIIVNPKQEEKTQSITFSPTSSTNIENKILSATVIPIDETGSTSIDVKGKKDVGTKAKGKVTVFNNDSDSIKLTAGTVITSANGLKFTLDSAVSIASASGDIFSGTKPGTADVNITADDIGTDYNLPSGTKFSQGNNNNVAAKNDNALTGGAKKSVTVVSKDDLQNALNNLPKELSDKAKSDIASKVQKGKTIIPSFINTDITNEKFDKKEGDQANQLTLKGTVSFNYIAYDNGDMASFATKFFENSDFTIQPSQINVDAKNIKLNKNKDISADLTIKANLLPKIDSNSLAKQIAGIDVTKAKNQLNNLTNVDDVNISISPNLPFLSSNLPKNSQNIIITITPK